MEHRSHPPTLPCRSHAVLTSLLSCLLARAELAHACGHLCLTLVETHRHAILISRSCLCVGGGLAYTTSLEPRPPACIRPSVPRHLHAWRRNGSTWQYDGDEEGCPHPFNLFRLDPSSHICRKYSTARFIPLTLNQTLAKMGSPNPIPLAYKL